MATNAMIGNQMPRILPLISRLAYDSHTARHTSQLQPIPDTKAWRKSALVLLVAAANILFR
ncbi:hypothetical protein D3C76_866570 [compost metagenome]